MRIDVRRWGVFNLVGVTGFVVQIGVLALLTRRWGWSPLAATAVALEGATFLNFLAHCLWTWSDRPVPSIVAWSRRFWRYQAAHLASFATNLAITTALLSAGLPAEAANTLAVLACAIPNYLLSEHLVFSTTPDSMDSPTL